MIGGGEDIGPNRSCGPVVRSDHPLVDIEQPADDGLISLGGHHSPVDQRQATAHTVQRVYVLVTSQFCRWFSGRPEVVQCKVEIYVLPVLVLLAGHGRRRPDLKATVARCCEPRGQRVVVLRDLNVG